jgi:hypothetical protein
MKRDARFYFANLGADVARCISAGVSGDEARYLDSLDRAYQTLAHLRAAGRPEAYEEGTLLLRGLEYSKRSHMLPAFDEHVSALIAEYAPLR